MAPPVWTLSVDLQTKTASFQSGMAEAAKTARYTFGSIGTDARNSGKEITAGTIETRSALGLFDSAIRGEHSMAMSDFIRLFEKSSAVMALIPFAAVAGGAIVLGEAILGVVHHMQEMKEKEELLARSLINFGTLGQNAFRSLDEKLLEAGIRTDELNHDHMAALKKELQLIDMQTLDELAKTFATFAAGADTAFSQLKRNWYEFGAGSAGASNALAVFKTQYDTFLAQGKGKEASDLLGGTIKMAEQHLAMLQARKAAMEKDVPSGGGVLVDAAMAASAKLRIQGVEKEIKAQQVLMGALDDATGAAQRQAALSDMDKSQAKRKTAGQMSGEHSSGAKEAASAQTKLNEIIIAAEKESADTQLSIHRAGIAARLASDIDYSTRSYNNAIAGNAKQIKALDKYSADYSNSLKELQDNALELTAQHNAAISGLKDKALVAQNALDLANIEAGERGKIDATRQGSAARLAAIDAALQEERSKNMQDLQVYKVLQTERVNVARQMAEEAAKKQADLTDVQVQGIQKMAEAEAQAKAKTMQTQAHGQPMHLEEITQAQKIANMSYEIKRAALQKELLLYEQAGSERVKDAAKMKMQLDSLDKQHVIDSKENQNQEKLSFKATTVQMEQSYASAFMQVAQGHRTLTQTMASLLDQSVQKTLAGLLAEAGGQKSEQMAYAKTAAVKAWNAMSGIPLVGPELGAVAAATTFAACMAFNKGTDYVPGFGHTDIVPAMLTPGEGVVPGGVMDGLRQMARNGNMQSGTTINHHQHVTYHVNTIDGDGMKDVLDKHADQLNKHFDNHVRKSNKK